MIKIILQTRLCMTFSRKDLLTSALPGNPPRQAPRYPTVLLAALEDTVMSWELPIFWRVLSWWLLLQSWRTHRFDDDFWLCANRRAGIRNGALGEVNEVESVWTRQKTDLPRLIVDHFSAYVHQKSWLVTGWQLLEKKAPYSRDYLLPAPSNNYKEFKNKDLKYHAAFAIQSQIIALASYRGQRIFRSNTGQFYTPHSGRTLYALGIRSAQLQQERSRHVGWLVSRGK